MNGRAQERRSATRHTRAPLAFRSVGATDWSDWFSSEGYATLAIDSFGPRSIDNICGLTGGSQSVTVSQRIGDAYGALRWLKLRADIDGDRVVLMESSHGGMTVDEAMSQSTISSLREIGQLRFRAGIAFYPHCPPAAPKFYAPVAIVADSADDWTPPKACVGWLNQHSYADSPLEVHVIEGATHAFDTSSWNIQSVGRRTYLQYHLAYDHAAVMRARAIVETFLRTRVSSQ